MERKLLIIIVVSIVVVVIVAGIVTAVILLNRVDSPNSPFSPTYFGCNRSTTTCEPGEGSQTYEECSKTCTSTPTVVVDTYGCNPMTGTCEKGFGTDDSTCSKSSPCEKLTYMCDQNIWTCKDTNVITNTSKSDCNCDPHMSTTPNEETYIQQFNVGDGIGCKFGFSRIDEYGENVFDSCWAGTCCETNFCGSFKPSASDHKQCAQLTDETNCKLHATTNGCEWSTKDNKCNVSNVDIGQCAKCTNDNDCKTMTDKGTCNAAGKCELSGIKCAQIASFTDYRTHSGKSDINSDAICNSLFKQPVNPCSNINDAYTCAKTIYTSKCKDKNNKDWATRTLECVADIEY